MTFPSGNVVVTTELAAGTGNPATARAQLYALATWFNELVASENLPNGVCVLNGAGQVDSEQFPASFAPTGILTLSPTDGYVKIEDVLRLQIMPSADLLAKANPVIGDMALCADDLTGTNPKLAMYDGTNWRGMALSSFTIIT